VKALINIRSNIGTIHLCDI